MDFTNDNLLLILGFIILAFMIWHFRCKCGNGAGCACASNEQLVGRIPTMNDTQSRL